MKNVYKLMASAIVLVACSTKSFAQDQATNSTATATANIVTPIALTKTADMNFGNIVASAAGGTVILAPNAGLTESGVTLHSGVTATAAAFHVTGEASYTYYVTLPGNSDVTLDKAAQPSMTLTDFTTNATGTTALTLGASNFSVGATLTVGANQAAGQYVSSGFDVTVNYN